MTGKTNMIVLKNDFAESVRIPRDQFSHVLIWPDSGHMNFWRKGDYSAIGTLNATPDTIIPDAEQVFHRLRGAGFDLIRVADNRPSGPFGFFVPETIQYFEDDLPDTATDKRIALTIAQMPFYLGDDEKADFKYALMRKTPQDDWLEFSPDLAGAFKTARGHYGFRKSTVTTLFASQKGKVLAVETTDKFRSFVPVADPDAVIDAVASDLPQLARLDNTPPPAYPVYYDPKAYPESRRHRVNIILRK